MWCPSVLEMPEFCKGTLKDAPDGGWRSYSLIITSWSQEHAAVGPFHGKRLARATVARLTRNRDAFVEVAGEIKRIGRATHVVVPDLRNGPEVPAQFRNPSERIVRRLQVHAV